MENPQFFHGIGLQPRGWKPRSGWTKGILRKSPGANTIRYHWITIEFPMFSWLNPICTSYFNHVNRFAHQIGCCGAVPHAEVGPSPSVQGFQSARTSSPNLSGGGKQELCACNLTVFVAWFWHGIVNFKSVLLCLKTLNHIHYRTTGHGCFMMFLTTSTCTFCLQELTWRSNLLKHLVMEHHLGYPIWSSYKVLPPRCKLEKKKRSKVQFSCSIKNPSQGGDLNRRHLSFWR